MCVCVFSAFGVTFELPIDLSIITKIIKFLSTALTDCIFSPSYTQL